MAIKITQDPNTKRFYLSLGGVPIGSRYGYQTRRAAELAAAQIDRTGRA